MFMWREELGNLKEMLPFAEASALAEAADMMSLAIGDTETKYQQWDGPIYL